MSGFNFFSIKLIFLLLCIATSVSVKAQFKGFNTPSKISSGASAGAYFVLGSIEKKVGKATEDFIDEYKKRSLDKVTDEALGLDVRVQQRIFKQRRIANSTSNNISCINNMFSNSRKKLNELDEKVDSKVKLLNERQALHTKSISLTDAYGTKLNFYINSMISLNKLQDSIEHYNHIELAEANRRNQIRNFFFGMVRPNNNCNMNLPPP